MTFETVHDPVGRIDRMAWELFIAGNDLTDPGTARLLRNTWLEDSPDGAVNRRAHRDRAQALLDIADGRVPLDGRLPIYCCEPHHPGSGSLWVCAKVPGHRADHVALNGVAWPNLGAL